MFCTRRAFEPTLFVIALCFHATAVHGDATRLVTVGDSITQASTDRFADGGYSYRYWLWRSFIDAGINVDFVGTQNGAFGGSGDPGWPDYLGQSFDRDHQGHWGQNTEFIRNNLPNYLTSYDADVAMIHIGHNDGWTGVSITDTRANLVQIVQTLQSDNPNIIVLLAEVVSSNPSQPPAGSSFPLSHINALNALMNGVAQETTTGSSPVHVIDLNTGFDPPTMIYDGVHPNALGEQFMAAGWLAAFQQYVPAPKSARVPALPYAGAILLMAILGWKGVRRVGAMRKRVKN